MHATILNIALVALLTGLASAAPAPPGALSAPDLMQRHTEGRATNSLVPTLEENRWATTPLSRKRDLAAIGGFVQKRQLLGLPDEKR